MYKTNKTLAQFYNRVYKKGETKHYTKLLLKAKSKLPLAEQEVLRLGSWKHKRVLDVGCGTGLMAATIAKRGARQVVGIDFSKEAIAVAQHSYQLPNLNYRTEDIKHHVGQYDVIVSLGTLEHMDKPEKTLALFKKHLRPGGKIIITSPNWTNPRGYILQTLRQLFNAPITLADLHYFTPIEFIVWAKKLKLALSWKTIDNSWSSGDKLIRDFKRRLPNIARDMHWKIKPKQFDQFIQWIQDHILPLNHRTKFSGATGVYIMRKK